MIVYRGQGMLENEFESIKKNKGGLISFNNFLSTTTDREVAQMFAESSRDDSDMIAILFRMEVNSSTPDIFYVNLKDISNFDDEDEILFSMNTIFRIEELNLIQDRLWEIELIATNANDSQIRNLTDHIRNEIKTIPGWCSMANLLLIMGRYEEAMKVLKLTNEITLDEDLEISQYFMNFDNLLDNGVFSLKEKYSAAVTKAKDLLEKCQQFYRWDNPVFVKLYMTIGAYYLKSSNYKDALLYAEKALELSSYLQFDTDIHTTNELIFIHLLIGQLHHLMSNFSLAVMSFEKASDLTKKFFPENHPNLLHVYYRIGESYRQLGKYSCTIKYLEQALTIGRKSVPTDHPIIIEILNSIGASHLSLSSYSSALSNFEEALNICERSTSLGNILLGSCYNHLATAYNKLQDYPSALSYYEKCLAACQITFPEIHPNIGLCYLNIGIVQTTIGIPSSALTHLEKALHIMQTTLSSDHLYLGYSYISIGELYRSLGKYSLALSHLEKGLEILQKTLPNDHIDLATTYQRISDVQTLRGDYTQMISAMDKSAQTSQNIISDNASLLSDGSVLIERSSHFTEMITAVSSTFKPILKLKDKFFSKNSTGSPTDNDITEIVAVLNNSKNGMSNIEQACKNSIQTYTSGNSTFDNQNNSLSDEIQLFEHGLHMISSTNRTLGSIQASLVNKQKTVTHGNTEYSQEQLLNNQMLKILSHMEEIIEIERKQKSPQDPFITTHYNSIGEINLLAQFYSIALYCFEKALAAMPAALPTNHQLYARTYSNMAKALDGLQRYKEAVDYAQRTVDVAHSSFDCSLDDTKIYEDQLHQLQRKSQ